jgi:glucosamine-6-phosphate deaminase
MEAAQLVCLDNIKVFIEDSSENVGRRAADIFCEALSQAPCAAFGFATGSTPICLYDELIARYRSGLLSMEGISAFNLDEYYPIEQGNDQSYDYFMKKQLFDHVNVSPEKRDIPSGEALDPELECRRYEEAIRAHDNFKLQIVGIGENGHIGFNEPAHVFPAKTNYVALSDSTITANARFFESEAAVPRHALTMGVGTIMMAEEILLIATGPHKSKIVAQSLLGAIDPQVSASALQMHRKVSVVLDIDAAQDFLRQLADSPAAS